MLDGMQPFICICIHNSIKLTRVWIKSRHIGWIFHCCYDKFFFSIKIISDICLFLHEFHNCEFESTGNLIHFVANLVVSNPQILTLGWAPWNLKCLEFKFDDTSLSYWHKNKIGRIEIFFCCFLTLQIFCPGSCLSKTEPANWAEN